MRVFCSIVAVWVHLESQDVAIVQAIRELDRAVLITLATAVLNEVAKLMHRLVIEAVPHQIDVYSFFIGGYIGLWAKWSSGVKQPRRCYLMMLTTRAVHVQDAWLWLSRKEFFRALSSNRTLRLEPRSLIVALINILNRGMACLVHILQWDQRGVVCWALLL